MKASVTRDDTTRIITVEVSDVPDVDVTAGYHRKPRVFRPERAVIRTVNGQVREIKVSGGLVLKSGKTSPEVHEDRTWYHDDLKYRDHTLSSAPDWVRTLWNEAPAGVLAWGQEVPV